jgi:hypothetical protein
VPAPTIASGRFPDARSRLSRSANDLDDAHASRAERVGQRQCVGRTLDRRDGDDALLLEDSVSARFRSPQHAFSSHNHNQMNGKPSAAGVMPICRSPS